jgi:hypothetical protein
LQENESTNYVIGVMSDTLDYDELPELWCNKILENI